MIFLNKSLKAEKVMAISPPILRNSLVWLFVVQIFILAPHFFGVPAWIAVVWASVVFWRWKVFQGAWNYPNKLRKTLVVLMCSAGLVVSLGVNVSLVNMVSLLLVGFILKLLEMKNRKDFVLLVYIAFFILATQFIVFNNILSAFYGFFCLALLCTLLMQLYQSPASYKNTSSHKNKLPHKNTLQTNNTLKNLWASLTPSIFILLQAIPFMFILFVVMPRLGSFWAVPTPQHSKTGMSDSMSPGDISELIQSDELAFRVTFNGDIPANEKLYWRSLVFSHFGGRRWSQAPQQLARQDFKTSSQPISGWREKIEYLGDKTTYNIIAEASGQPWLYVLAAPETWSNDLLLGSDLHLQAIAPVIQRISYTVTSALNYRFEEGVQNAIELNQNLQLPVTGNPETRRIAGEWFAETGNAEKLIEKLFHYYHSNFSYTLRPPSLGGDSVDEFLWQSRQGFCEHFSSSFVFFMRAAGIPARVVVGYQGGELNTVENYLAIRQRDAHAWAEVWINHRGWVLYDPTSAVAPERIRRGIVESLNATDQKLLSQHFGSSLQLLMLMRDQWDALNFQWTRWVMNYDSAIQTALLSKFLHDVNPLRIALLVLGAGGISVMLTFAVLFFRSRRKKISALERSAQLVYQQLCKKLKGCGVAPVTGESPRHFVLRAATVRPDLAPLLNQIIDLYEQVVYAENVSVLMDLKRKLANFSSN